MWWLLLLLSPTLGFQLNREPPPPPVDSRATVRVDWFNARLNHFDASNTETFPMRFFFNNRGNFRNIVIFVGGEWEITEGWVTGGLAHDLAARIRASVFYTEHRYYGLTRPTRETSVQELRFLTVDQALADLAQFITYIKSSAFENGFFRGGNVILVGCSYAGSMATWMRVQYPHLVDAVVSDSGPLLAQQDFPEYLRVVGNAIEAQGGRNCYDSIQQTINQVSEMLGTTNGRAQVSQMFNTCSTLTASPLDIATFHWLGLVYSFAVQAQYALPGELRAVCDQLTNPNITTPVERLAGWVRAQPWSQPCIETRYTEVVQLYRNTSFDSPVATSRAWFYQTCVEYGWYQTTNAGSSQPFGSGVPLEYFQQMCVDFFSSFFDSNRTSYGISRTNLFFGGLTQLPDRVVSVAGQFDPWHPVGPNVTHARPQAPVFFVSDISHCRIIHSLNDSETEAVRAVKMEIIDHIDVIVHGVPPSSASKVVGSISLLLVALLRFL